VDGDGEVYVEGDGDEGKGTRGSDIGIFGAFGAFAV
jgi:hypothetical protein